MGGAQANRTIEAQKFVLRDTNGKMRAELNVDPEGPVLRPYYFNGAPQVRLGGDPEGTSLVFFDRGRIQALLGVSSSGPSLELNDNAWRKRVELEIQENEPFLRFYDSKGGSVWFAPHPEPDHNDSIRLGSTELTLGMTEDELLRTLATDYDESEGPRTEGQVGHHFGEACRKGNSASCGTLTFGRGRLESVDINRGPEDPTKGVDFAESIYYGIADFVREGSKACELGAKLTDAEKIATKTTSVYCGQKYISIHIDQFKGQAPLAWVGEGLEGHR